MLRAQGTLEVRGTLRRSLRRDPPPSLAVELEVFNQRRAQPAGSWGTLTEWLERSLQGNDPWTVLVAGGELRVPGRIEVEGPLMLIAGGWIRISGRVEAGSVWKSSPGGDNVLRAFDVPLRLDAPLTNPLGVPLRLAILTNPFRPAHGVEAWRTAVPRVHAGGGGASLQFVGLRDREGRAGTDRYGPVSRLSLLQGCQALRMLVIVSMPVGRGEEWDPPVVQAVELTWDEPRDRSL